MNEFGPQPDTREYDLSLTNEMPTWDSPEMGPNPVNLECMDCHDQVMGVLDQTFDERPPDILDFVGQTGESANDEPYSLAS